MRYAVVAWAILFLHYNEAALAFFGSPWRGLPLMKGGRATNTQLHWSLSVECDDCGEQGSSFSSRHLSTITTADNRLYDLVSPREWLEFCESENGNGAYTVMRCDFDLCKKEFFILWGTDFHLNRLESSFATTRPANNGIIFNRKREKSEDMIHFLLKHAKEKCQEIPTNNDESFCTFMVTILWQPNNDDITIQGHIFSSLTPTDVRSSLSPNFLTAAIAIDPDHSLPNRFQNSPKAKLISWCRTRRPLEETFKKNGVAEVLLTRNRENRVEILEGLTSNVFVLYPENVLRTSETNAVLGGYARHLVIEAAKARGLTVEIGPIRMEDANLWQEVFLTSSIRVIGPVEEIVVPDPNGSSKSLWRMKDNTRQDVTSSLIWMQLLSDIYHTVHK